MTKVEIRLDPALVDSVIGGMVTKACERAAAISADRMRSNISSADRINTGTMLASVTHTQTGMEPLHPIFEVGAYTPYAAYQEHGIGPVFPLRAEYLAFVPKGGSTMVFARETAGFAGAHFAQDTAEALTPADFA